MPKIAIIHTSPLTVEIFTPLAAEILPGAEVVHVVDASMLAQIIATDGDISQLRGQLEQHAKSAEGDGADIILSACSTLGPLASLLRDHVSIPVVRVDDAMAEEAVRRGSRIGVAATIKTTLVPTTALLHQKARDAGREITVIPRLASAAFERLSAGDKDGHDAILIEALAELARDVDVVVLAQASMSRVLPKLPADARDKFLTSPRLGVEQVKAVLETLPR